ncbi:MAG: energy transducer TonB [Acidithiobacillus sp.]|uniref:energy transducer TonB n=1 Tax=Acidithiobacillus sp. TaxID=1872118 RepID=UPI003D007536
MPHLKRRILRSVSFGLDAGDLDQLFPWLLLSSLCLGSLFLLALGTGALTLPRVPPISSYVQIDLVSAAPADNAGSPALPVTAAGQGLPVQRAATARAPSATPSDPQQQLAAYLREWERRVAQIAGGTLAGQAVPQGRLVVAITIDPAGHLRQVQILRGGEHRDLVLAVENILQQAAPFPPLPPSWQHPPQDLRIVRTWNFE